MRVERFLLFLCFLFPVSNSTGQAIADDGKKSKITIIVEPLYGGTPLVLNKEQYHNEHGDLMELNLFKFYITNVQFCSENIPPNKPFTGVRNNHLFDAEDSATYQFTVEVPVSESVKGLAFILGVDSIDNTNGANGGDLDPVKGLYWAWNSGYIMAKLEGKSKVCPTLHHEFGFHIGGYLPPFNAARQVWLPLPSGLTTAAGAPIVIRLSADVAAWFSGNLDLARINSVFAPGKEACEMADRYVKMFSINSAGK